MTISTGMIIYFICLVLFGIVIAIRLYAKEYKVTIKEVIKIKFIAFKLIHFK